MREFLQVLKRFLPPYKKYLTLSVIFNILSAVLNIFSFAALIPILQILFQTDQATAATRLMDWSEGSVREVLSNNADYYIGQMVGSWGATTTLLVIGLFLAFMTFLKTGAYFLSSVTDAQAIYNYLMENGIIVRNRNKIALCGNCLRVTIGTRGENNELLGALRQY